MHDLKSIIYHTTKTRLFLLLSTITVFAQPTAKQRAILPTSPADVGAASDVASINANAALSPAPYLGQVATRCFVPNSQGTSSLITWVMACSAHWSRDKVTNPTLVFANFRVNGTNAETTTGAGTIKPAIEYPASTFTLLTRSLPTPMPPSRFLSATKPSRLASPYPKTLNLGAMLAE